jgi:hypothetical protein
MIRHDLRIYTISEVVQIRLTEAERTFQQAYDQCTAKQVGLS